MFKQLLFALLVVFAVSQLCPSKVIERCEQDLSLALQECEKAAKEKGQDQTADINCVKYLLSSRKDCWPCICEVAKQMHIKVKGCDIFVEAVQAILNLRT